MVKNLPAMQETRVLSLGREDPLEEGKATHSSIPFKHADILYFYSLRFTDIFLYDLLLLFLSVVTKPFGVLKEKMINTKMSTAVDLLRIKK